MSVGTRSVSSSRARVGWKPVAAGQAPGPAGAAEGVGDERPRHLDLEVADEGEDGVAGHVVGREERPHVVERGGLQVRMEP